MVHSPAEKAATLKEQGTAAFQKKDYDSAAKLYGEAIAISNCDHVLYSNRSAAYAGEKKYEEALADACKCVELKPDFAKGYGRMALAQFHMGKLIDAKKNYEEGLKHDSQNQVLKTGLRETEKSLRSWFLSVLAEAADAQDIVQQSICEATRQVVAAGCTSMSFLEAHQKVLHLNLPRDTLDKYGISEEDCQQFIGDYQKAYDYEVMTAVQRMFMPTSKGDAERAAKIEIATILDAHEFMVAQMKSLVDEFNRLPPESKQSVSKKDRERSAELLVTVAVESSFNLHSEDMDLAVSMREQELQQNPALLESQSQIASLMQLLMEWPFIEKVVDLASGHEDGTAKVSASPNPLGSSNTSALACKVGICSALGLVALLGLSRWRATSK